MRRRAGRESAICWAAEIRTRCRARSRTTASGRRRGGRAGDVQSGAGHYSERQLQQVMDDFGLTTSMCLRGGRGPVVLDGVRARGNPAAYDGQVQGPADGDGEEPAMLFYLDNFLSADPRAADRMAAERAARQRRRGGFGRPRPQRVPQQQRAKKNVRGLNENYGRELMELHTLELTAATRRKM